MATITCAFCGKMEKGLLVGIPFDDNHKNLKMCRTCYTKKADLICNVSVHPEKITEGSSYFIELLSSGKVQLEAKEVLENFLKSNREKSLKFQEIQKAEMEQKEEEKRKQDRERELKVQQEKAKQEEAIRQAQNEEKWKNRLSEFMVTTGYDFSGYQITKYCNVYTAESVLGTGLASELKASLSDFVGDYSQAFEDKIDSVKNEALRKLKLKAAKNGCDALIGVAFNMFTFSNNMIAVSVHGTGVIIEKMRY